MTDDDPTSSARGGTLVHLFGPPPAVEGAPEVAERVGFCYPHGPIVDKISRLVTCRRCKATLDPVDVLLEVARKYDEWQRLSTETRTLRAEIEALRGEEKRIKARTKNHARKDATAAVAAERERLAAMRAEIMCRTDDARRALKRIDQLAGCPSSVASKRRLA